MPNTQAPIAPVWTDNWRFPGGGVGKNKALLLLASTSNSLSRADGASAEEAEDEYQDPQGFASTAAVAVRSVGTPGMADDYFTSANFFYASVILLVTILLVSCSLLTICALSAGSNKSNRVLGCYLVSLAVSDLLCGLIITPFSLAAALSDGDQWPFGDEWCRVEAYLEVVLWISHVFDFIWIGRIMAFIIPESKYRVAVFLKIG